MTTDRIRTCSTLLLASLLAFSTLSSSAVTAARRAQARAAYDRAVRMRTALASQPENARPKAEYEKLIRAFQAVYRTHPAYSKTPVALAAVAELYEEMGRVFASDRYYHASIEAYQFLIAQYPHNRLSRDALLSIGEVYRSELENPEEARKAFQRYLEQFPNSPRTSEAQSKLKQIDKLLAERAVGRAAAARSTAENQRTDRVPEVTAIRRWVGPNYTRIVISVDGEVKFDASRVANPDRIFFDLANTRLSPALVSKVFPVEGGFLRQIRVAQYRPTVTRVVLDVEKIEDYSVFSLPNPFRLVIDVHGAPAAVAEKPKAPSGTAPVPAESTRASSKTAGPVATVAPRPAPPGPAPTSQPPARSEPDAEAESTGRGVETKGAIEAASQPQPRESEAKETASLKSPSAPAMEGGVSSPRETPLSAKPAAPTESGSTTLTRALGLKIARMVIDPGHGGHDTGTIGPTGLREKDLVLDVALRLKKLVERNMGSDVVMTRNDDTFIPLEERTAVANEKAADLFISIHANASRDRRARGIETYYLNFTSSPEALEVAARENATSQESVHQLQDLIKKIAMTEKIEESHEFAMQVQREVLARLGKASSEQRNRGVKKAPFVVLIGANMPSILAEISFLTNPRDERLLKRPEYRQRIADALYQGIARYVNTLGGVRVAQQTRAAGAAEPPVGTSAREATHPPDF